MTLVNCFLYVAGYRPAQGAGYVRLAALETPGRDRHEGIDMMTRMISSSSLLLFHNRIWMLTAESRHTKRSEILTRLFDYGNRPALQRYRIS